ncbi:MAG: hypothetical protein QOF34_1083, partial [Sphingomonadales bacterium]|nr:hypothetical protein [Sphingomonadales bacterium]
MVPLPTSCARGEELKYEFFLGRRDLLADAL